MKHKIYLILLLIIICEPSLFAQNPALRDSVDRNKYNFSQFGNETVDFIKQPTKWNGSDWLKLGLISAGTFLIMETADQPIREAVLKDQRYYKSVPIEFGRMWGELYSPIVLFGGFAIHSMLTNDKGTRKIAYEIGQASLYAGAVDYILKLAIGRARPYMEEGKSSFHPFSSLFSQNYHSIPGGHNTAAFAISTVLSRNAKPIWLKGLAYVPAVLTFISRVYQDQHWTSDDFLGAALGYVIATWVVDQHEQGDNGIQVSSVYPLTIRIALD
ncbi:MAG: phosphatase PAP2 family protein [Bacteroidota bacterium]